MKYLDEYRDGYIAQKIRGAETLRQIFEVSPASHQGVTANGQL